MYFQIRRVVLWSRNPALEPRELAFELGKVNVITGASKTGKSAIIPIIDYCLGSDYCAIPVRTIRQACAWFGVVVTTSEGEKLLARREPGEQQSTGDMYLVEGETITLPRTIDIHNTNVESVKAMLDRLAGLSNLGFEPTGVRGGFRGRPSFRDLLAFVFQAQNVVANPDVLFYKADTVEHREKLQTIFPYVLGAVTPELLAKRWEIEQKMAELKRKEREFAAHAHASERWKAELRVWVSEARDLGLLGSEEVDSASEEHDFINLVQKAVSKTSRDARLTEATIEADGREATELDREEGGVALEMIEVRTRLDQMQRLRASVDAYTGGLTKQRSRLELSRWLRELHSGGAPCPTCGGESEAAAGELNALCDALAGIEASARQLSPVPAVFDKEMIQVKQEVRRLADRLEAVRLRKRSLEERSKRVREAAWKASAVDRYLGRAEQALAMFTAPAGADATRQEVERLRQELEELRAGISEAGVQRRINAALERVAGFMSRLLPHLDAERPDDPAELNIKELTVRVTGESGRRDFLWELGSGANWLSYHVAATLALQSLFLADRASPVPSLLVYDQPSQVYFPQTFARATKDGHDPEFSDEDTDAVRKVFSVLGDATTSASGHLQVLVLDHAGASVWGSLHGVHLVEEWRAGKKLVPASWIPQ